MKLTIVLLLIGAAIAAVNCKSFHGDKTHKLNKAWAAHKAKHHPDLNSPEEENQLKARFAKTDEMIHKHNSDPNVKHHIGHNHFSTMTNEEKRIHLFGVKSKANNLDKVWAQHKAKYHPEMDSPEEETARKSHFAKAHQVIEKHNSDPEATHRWGHLAHNHFSAMTRDEKKKHFFGVKPATESAEQTEAESEVDPEADVEDMMRAPRPAIPIIHRQGPSANRVDGGGSSITKPTTPRPRCTGLCRGPADGSADRPSDGKPPPFRYG